METRLNFAKSYVRCIICNSQPTFSRFGKQRRVGVGFSRYEVEGAHVGCASALSLLTTFSFPPFFPPPPTSLYSPPLHFTTPPTPGGLKSETLNFKKIFHKFSIIPYNYIDLSEKSQNSVIRKLEKMTSMKTPSIYARVNIKRRELYRKYVLNSPFAK